MLNDLVLVHRSEKLYLPVHSVVFFQTKMPDNIQSQLFRLTTRDCEVNAPIQPGGLLQGAELLKALEIDLPQAPR